MFDYLISDDYKKLRDKVRAFVRDEVPHSLLKQMDRDEVIYPKEYVQNLAKHGLLGLRFDKKYGGQGLNWEAEVLALEEIGVLGASLIK